MFSLSVTPFKLREICWGKICSHHDFLFLERRLLLTENNKWLQQIVMLRSELVRKEQLTFTLYDISLPISFTCFGVIRLFCSYNTALCNKCHDKVI